MANDNPSVVNDASGNNYGGIGTASMGQAQMQYLENLQQLAMKAPPKPLSNEQYMPGETQGIQRGTYSSPTTGSVPIFAANNLIPFGMLDNIRRASYEGEAAYYAQLKTYLDKPLATAKVKLKNPVAQPSFGNKIQQVTDKMLEISTNRAGGNHMMGYIRLQQDPDYLRFLENVSQYADLYNTVYTQALDVVKKMENPMEFYVSPDEKATVNKFLTTQEVFNKDNSNTSFDELAKATVDFQAQMSIFKLAEAATAHVKADVIQSAPTLDKVMSTQAMNVYTTETITGSKEEAEEIYNNVLESSPELKDDPERAALLKKQIAANVEFGKKNAMQTVRKAYAAQQTDIKKLGVGVKPDGSLDLKTQYETISNSVMSDVVTMPATTKPVYVPSQSYVYVRTKGGTLLYAKMPQSYPMITSYMGTITKDAEKGIGSGTVNNVAEGSYFVGKVLFSETDVNQREDVRTATQQGTITDERVVGNLNPTKVPQKVTFFDELSKSPQDIYGDFMVLVPKEVLRTAMEGQVPGLDNVNRKLDEQYYPFTDRRNQSLNPNKQYGSTERPITIPPDASPDYVEDSKTIFYKFGDKVLSGYNVHRNLEAQAEDLKKGPNGLVVQ